MRNIQSPLYYHSALPSGVLQIEDALLREPRLWSPKQKPLGPVSVDWDHKATSGLFAAFLFRTAKVTNEVKPEAVYDETATAHPQQLKGAAYFGTATDNWYYNVGTISNSFPEMIGSPFTIMAHVDLITTGYTTRAPVIDCVNAFQNEFFIRYDANGSTWGCEVWANGQYNSVGSGVNAYPAPERDRVVALVFDDSYTLRLYVDDGNTWADASPGSSFLTGGPTEVLVGAAPSNSSRLMYDYLESIYMWNRALSHAEFMNLSKDPYQIFGPA